MQRKSSSKCFRQTISSNASMFLCTTPIHLVETTVICLYLGSNYLKRKSHFLGPWQGCKRTEGELRDRKCLNVIISLSGWHFSGILSLPSCRFNSIRVHCLHSSWFYLVTSKWLPETFLGSENVFFASSCSEAHFAQKALQCLLVMWLFPH